MPRSQLRVILPAVYGVVLLLLGLTGSGTALVVVAVVGAMALGAFYSTNRGAAFGRQRNRNRRR